MENLPKIIFEYTLFGALGMSIATPLMLLNVRFAPKLGLIDWPKARGLSDQQVPIIGHTLVLLSLIYFGFLAYMGQTSGFVLASTCFIALMGHLDDQRSRPAIDKILVQLFCVICVVLFDPAIHQAISVQYGAWGTFWAIFFILGLMNAINFIDGIDGLAGIVITAGSFGYLLFSHHHTDLQMFTLYSVLLIGGMIPFLYLNVFRRKGFLGNVGSYTLSYLLAVQHLSIPIESGNIIARLALPGLCFIVPIADATMVLISRLSSRRSPFQADKGHLHHRLMQTSLPLRHILCIFAAIEFMGVIMGFFLTHQQVQSLPMIPISVCFATATMIAMLIVLVEKTSRRRVQGFFSHLDQGESVFFLKYKVTQPDGADLPPWVLRRLEARVNAEIRVSDVCFSQEPSTLFVTLRNSHEPFKGISARLDRIFDQEKVKTALVIEEGEFIKVARNHRTSVNRPSLAN